MTSQLVILRAFLIFFFVPPPPDPRSEKKSRKSTNKKFWPKQMKEQTTKLVTGRLRVNSLNTVHMLHSLIEDKEPGVDDVNTKGRVNPSPK